MRIETKARIYKATIRPIMTYTAETRPETTKTTTTYVGYNRNENTSKNRGKNHVGQRAKRKYQENMRTTGCELVATG